MHRTSKFVVASPRASKTIDPRRLLMAFFVVAIFIASVAAVMVAASTGHPTAALSIALVAGGCFASGIFC